MAWLRVIEGRRRGSTYLLTDEPRVAGHDPDNRIYLDDQRASRMHARFEWTGSHHRIVELNSTAGTTLNGKPLRSTATLHDQDRIKIGSHLLVYEQRGRPGYRDEGLATKGWIRVAEGVSLGATYRLGPRRGGIGRDPGNLIQLIDDDTSRHHARIEWDGQDYVLSDLGSTNGTKVNGVPRAEHHLRNGDRIEIGEHVLVYEAKGSVRYRDEGLSSRNVAPGLTTESTNIVHAASLGIGSIDIDVEVVEDTSADEQFENSPDPGQSIAARVLTPATASRPVVASPEQLSARARKRVTAQVRVDTTLPEFLEAAMNETARFVEPDRIVFLFFSGAALSPRAARVRGQPTSVMPNTLLQAAIRHVIRHKRAVRKNDLLAKFQGDPRERATAVATVVCAPIVSPHVDYGVIYADNLGPNAARFGSLELEYFRELGELIATGVAFRTQRRARQR